MPTGVYPRTEKHSFNKGKKHPNRKPYFKGVTVHIKKCACCGKEYSIVQNHKRSQYCSRSCRSRSIPIHGGWKQSGRQREMMRNRKGMKHPRWIKEWTIILEKHIFRNSSKWKEWRTRVFTRDKHTCQECLQIGGKLEPHHIIPLRITTEKVYEVNNGITLCRPCHQKTIFREEDFSDKYLKNVLAKL